jgi:hypothetical protein
VLQHRIRGQEIQRFGMMPLADFAQVAIAREHLVAAWRGRFVLDGVLIPERDGGDHSDPRNLQAGLSRVALLSGLSEQLPEMVDQLT